MALNLDLLAKEKLENKLEINLGEDYLVIVFHPVTLESKTAKRQIKEITAALDKKEDLIKVFIKSNSDAEGRVINEEITRYTQSNRSAYKFTSLPVNDYLSLIKNSKARQKGRIKAESVIDCSADKKDIINALELIESQKFQEKVNCLDNPYSNGQTSKKISEIIQRFLEEENINLKKEFHDLDLE